MFSGHGQPAHGEMVWERVWALQERDFDSSASPPAPLVPPTYKSRHSQLTFENYCVTLHREGRFQLIDEWTASLFLYAIGHVLRSFATASTTIPGFLAAETPQMNNHRQAFNLNLQFGRIELDHPSDITSLVDG